MKAKALKKFFCLPKTCERLFLLCLPELGLEAAVLVYSNLSFAVQIWLKATPGNPYAPTSTKLISSSTK